MDVSIIIVSYNTNSLLEACLDSVYKHTEGIEFEVIVSDNNSTDGSLKMLYRKFPQVKLIENGQNLGFGAANNVALKEATGKYVLYLNSDTILLNNAVKIFYDYWEGNGEKEHLGAIGGMLIGINGKNGDYYGKFKTTRSSIKYLRNCFLSSIGVKYIYSFFRETNRHNEYYGNVDYVIGADLFVRNNHDAVFDERFFMYFEDNDLQREMSKKDLARKIIPGPKIMHLEGGSGHKNNIIYRFNKPTSVYYWASCIIYLRKYGSNPTMLKFLVSFILILPWNLFSKNGFHRLKHILSV